MTDLEKALAEGGQPVETDLSRALAEGGTPVGDETSTAPAAPEARSFLERAKDTVVGGAKAIGHVAGEQIDFARRAITDPAGTFGTPEARKQAAEDFILTNPAKRREFERGVGDVTTLGYANKAAEALDRATGEGKLTPEEQAKDAENAPGYRTGGQIVGTFLPNPVGAAAGTAGKVAGATAERLAPAAAKGVTSFLSKVPKFIAAPAKGAASYEATAPAAGALNADAEGHRLEAAKEAATDPAGLALSAAASTVPEVLSSAAGKLQKGAPAVEEAARGRAVKDLGNDITNPEGIKARATDQQRVAEVNERLFELAQEHPEMRRVFGMSAEKALPKIQEFKQAIAEPLDRIYDAIDADTNGGIPLEKAVGDLRKQARTLREDLPVGNQRIADLIERKADEFEEQYGKHGTLARGGKSEPTAQQLATGEKPREWTEEQWQQAEDEWNGKHVRDDAHKTVGDKTKPGGKGEASQTPDLDRALADLEKLRANAKGVAVQGIDEQIAKIKAEQKTTSPEATADTVVQDRGIVIPTKQFRREVTELLKHADSSMGEIEGSKRHALLSQLYDAGKEVIDNHIDGSGVPQAAKDQLRKINDQYFLVSRAEAAIESRGYKEANKPGGFHIPHTVAQATRNLTGATGLATAAGFAAANPHSIPYIAATLAASKVLPAAAKSANWWAANGGYARAIGKLAELATKAQNKSTFVSQAVGAGLGAQAARRIFEAAHPQQGAAP